MSLHVCVPASREPSVLATLTTNQEVNWRIMPPEVERLELVEGTSRKVRVVTDPMLEWLNSLTNEDIILAPLGGAGDALLVGALQRGATVKRVTFNALARYTGPRETTHPANLNAVETRESGRQTERLKTAALMRDVHRHQPVLFRLYEPADATVSMVRTLIIQLIAIQDELRKRLEQREAQLKRDQRYVLGKDSPLVPAFDLRFDFIQKSEPVEELIKRENELERQIQKLLERLDVYTKVMKPVIGLGPRISARIIASIIDIRRFQTLSQYKQYAGWSVIERDGREQAWQFTRNANKLGIKGACPLLRQAIWLTGDQIVRQKLPDGRTCQFRWWYEGYKRRHQNKIGQVMAIIPEKRTVIDGEEVITKGGPLVMTKGWLDKRARRYAASNLLTYVFQGWWELHGRQFVSKDGRAHQAEGLLRPGDWITDPDFFAPIEYGS